MSPATSRSVFLTRLKPSSTHILLRSRNVNGRSIRSHATQPNGRGSGNQNMSEMFNRRTMVSAWNALSPNQKMIFGGLVAIGAYFEYTLLDKYLLQPVKSRKEDEKRLKMEQELGIGSDGGSDGVGADGVGVGVMTGDGGRALN
ncbi:uncharacterized protein I303_104757 [Kwoniella dejecticola CBS 10117]|uniref:Uncharacterized protein n=1 Tax=Kwoniella dejecticola CBS 10117 TaxID=1296121 RepID=A0A1A6A4F1_9TREE|nr:uncharacterized protein I303_04262 [Kwoniella dejecticola CBS 10117]OBR84937.1 hypothetical protein I303_04262 [Kwoniella dejecticola CBS 10117]